MKITVTYELDDGLLREALRGLMENYPEASTPSLRCVKWKYKECQYVFEEMNDDGEIYKTHAVDLLDLVYGFDKAMKNRPTCIPLPPERQTKEAWDDWCCSMDADGVDCLLQFALFGELIYG